MKIILTNYASFYKINLFNSINEIEKVVAIFTGVKNLKNRNNDFFKGEMKFEYYFVPGKNKYAKIRALLKSVDYKNYNELIIDGWDSKENWWSAFYFPKKKNSLIVESSILESKITGYKALLKKIFLSRISKAYPSGKLHKDLLLALGFKGEIRITGGVGLMNRIPQPHYIERESVKNFIYVGRLVPVKNLELLIQAFNELPNLNLSIIGFGILEDELKTIAKNNIKFEGAIDNKALPTYYQSSDVFILPSKSEPWGLVVEEALNNGLPLILSDKVGCKDDLLTDKTGLLFKSDDKEDLKRAILKMTDIEFYNKLRLSISKMDFEKREQEQIAAYI